MIKQIRTSKFTKFVAWYLIIIIFLESTSSMGAYALTSGPKQPEFNAFTPISTSDMVDLSSGDFNYNIPIMDIGGYPINLAYNSGVSMDQEASWVGLGWNLNLGQITRQVRGLPDDFKGDTIQYINNLKPNRTVGFTFRINGQLAGAESEGSNGPSIGGNAALTLQHNNYNGISAVPSLGLSYEISKGVSVGMNITSSATEGVSVSPQINGPSFSMFNSAFLDLGLSLSAGLSYNSRQGLQNYNLVGVNGSSKIINNLQFVNSNSSMPLFKRNFINNTFTPTLRNEFSTLSGTFNASLGGHAYLFDGEVGVTGFYSNMKLKDKVTNEKAFGYEFTHNATDNDLLDYNRENDRVVTKNIRVLPVTNYTYDTYNLQTQGMSGSFRPFQSQVGYVFDPKKSDISRSGSLGVEAEFGWGVHFGVDVEYSQNDVNAGVWNTPVANYFKKSGADNLKYENTYFKFNNDFTLNKEMTLYKVKLGEKSPIDFKLLDINNLNNSYRKKETSLTSGFGYTNISIDQKIKRENREYRNQVIYKVTNKEAEGDVFIKKNSNAKKHHTVGYRAVNNDGSTYIFGETVYNKNKSEVTFAIPKDDYPDDEGIYTNLTHASENNKNGIDHYYNKISTPAYADTYLLTSVLSTDYEDITGNGPTDDDLGSYTKFIYKDFGNYKWRAPYYGASYNPGFNSDRNHKKASYTYGEKELKYISRIETKTHVAIFELSPRKDGLGVNGESNIQKNFNSESKMYKLDRIKLYSKPEAIKANLLNDNPNDDLDIAPIKTANFVYSYDLCKGIHNNYGSGLHDNEISNLGGKLTLKKVYFTYRNSNMGKYTPYVFDYNQNNPTYEMKAFDVWGNYKENNGTGRMLPTDVISSVEYPYVEQNKAEADINTAAWHLQKIHLPSGGVISIETESDDYQFVQDKLAMQMFKVVGVSKKTNNQHLTSNHQLYGSNYDCDHILIEVDQQYNNDNFSHFLDKYIGDQIDKPIFFRFLLNMSKGGNDYDYVEGYLKIDKTRLLGDSGSNFITFNGKLCFALPITLTDMEGGVNGNRNVNPISKAGWYFGRQNMNKTVYGLPNDPDEENVFDVVNAISSSFQTMTEIFTGPNGRLRNKEGCAKYFKNQKSWIRLLNPSKKKLGGGNRVKSISLSDNWKNMLDGEISLEENGTNLSSMDYGQVYEYNLEDGSSSGVATFEPLGAKDNPFIEPFYDKGERLVAPKETNYTEKPFGLSFFPSPTVTYSRVSVKNLPRTREQEGKIVKKHATGFVVNHFYTSKDFPTKTDFTELKNGENLKESSPNPGSNFLAGLLGLPIIDETKLTATQGFVIETNDMNGKEKKQQIFDENRNLISEVEYNYKVTNGELNNEIEVINSEGEVSKSLIGVDYDVINDFRQNVSTTNLYGFKGNVSLDIWSILPPVITVVVTAIPSYAKHSNILRMATTTKVVHKKGILVETIAKDLGSTVSTKNLLWDAQSGQVLLTETINEYDDHYYNFNYPAYWNYEGMGLASNNIGVKGILKSFSGVQPPTNSPSATSNPYFQIEGYSGDISKIFHIGDELYTEMQITGSSGGFIEMGGEFNDESGDEIVSGTKMWVVGYNSLKTGVLLMDINGNYINKCADYDKIDFKIVRSGYRNLQSASMASVTTMINPLKDLNNDGNLDFNFNLLNFDGNSLNPRVVNATAVVYKDFWRPQYEVKYYPDIPDQDLTNRPPPSGGPGGDGIPITNEGLPKYPYESLINPFVWNVKGEWRVEKSYAYLSSRKAGTTVNNPRNSGFFSNFSPFYKLDENKKWFIDKNNWTFATSITQYSPYGPEIENKDALERYSSAQYAYSYKLPIAVASNSKYRNMGFESFESDNKHFPFLIPIDNISTENSHTGKKSIKVPNGEVTELSSSLLPTAPVLEILNDCPIVNSGGGGTSGDCSNYYSVSYSNGTIIVQFNVPIQLLNTNPQTSPCLWFNVDTSARRVVITGTGCASCSDSIRYHEFKLNGTYGPTIKLYAVGKYLPDYCGSGSGTMIVRSVYCE